jgi:predicted nucleic acid-binding protein
MLVIDASLTLSWYFEDERPPAADAVLDQVGTSGAVVPSLWRLEIANGLQVAIRRQRIDVAFRDLALTNLARLPITIDADTDAHVWTTTLQLADRFQLTIYDAVYLELAQRRVLPLATLDSALRTAAEALGVPVLGV